MTRSLASIALRAGLAAALGAMSAGCGEKSFDQRFKESSDRIAGEEKALDSALGKVEREAVPCSPAAGPRERAGSERTPEHTSNCEVSVEHE